MEVPISKLKAPKISISETIPLQSEEKLEEEKKDE
jgi:hypothetical protein